MITTTHTDVSAAIGVAVIVMLVLFLVALAVAITAFWIWMLISAVQNKGLPEGEKIAWVLVIAFLHLLGAILYFFIGHPKRFTPIPPR